MLHWWSAQQDRKLGIMLSLIIHSVILWTGGRIFFQTAQYGVESGYGGLEVNLVAALPKAAEQTHAPAVLESTKTEPELQIPEEALISKPVPEPSPAAQAESSAVGDGSSPIPGTAPTTLYVPGGAQSRSNSRYLRNPAPPYPDEARRRGQQGLVLLRVQVNPTGLPTKVEIKRSSGFSTLDYSAEKTVHRWKFVPAQLGPIAVDSTVEVPIRFVLYERHERSDF